MYGSASCAGREDGIDVDAALSLVTSMLKVADIEEVMLILFLLSGGHVIGVALA